MSAGPARTVAAGGAVFAYARAGRGDPVALVHGNLASHRYWQELLDDPPDGLELIAMDLPNFGDSGPLPGRVSMRAYGDALAAFLSALELPAVTLVGHSLGGAVAQACAGTFPEGVARLVLVDSPPPDDYHGPEASIRGFQLLAGAASPFARRTMIAQALPAVMPTRRPPYLQELIDEACKIPPGSMMPTVDALETMALGELVRAYRGPVLVLRGGKDYLITPELAEATVDAFGPERARLVTWDDVGHSPQIEAPERFRALLADFARTEFVGDAP